MNKRNAEADLKICNAATPGPWYVYPELCGPDGQGVFHVESGGCICFVGDPYPRGDNRPQQNMEFIVMAREALPYWIKRAQELYEALVAMVEEADAEAKAASPATPAGPGELAGD